MARKCGRCREEGHTITTCTEASDVQHAYEGRKEEEPEHTYADPQPDSTKGPWFPASRDGECDTCDGAIFAGDEIRADGSGGWECQANCAPYDSADERATSADSKCEFATVGHPGVAFAAKHLSVCDNDVCTRQLAPGDLIRSDGAGGYECAGHHVHSFTWNSKQGFSECSGCGESDTAAAKAARTGGITNLLAVAEGIRAGTRTVEPDPWDVPTPPAPELNASGQPAPRYEWHGKQNRGYLVKDPATGDFRRYKNGKPKGWTRATTFNKAATDQNQLSDWGKRNVLIGASLRPDVVLKAHGLTHARDKAELMSLVSELETAAGAKVSAQVGTDIHELTERWDAGQLESKDIPKMYRHLIFKYEETLKAAGLRAVPGLIERTTCIQEFGGVVGTLDRVYLHEASGQYVIGDVKTGKTLEYGMDEIETQEWIYAHGVNEHGVYDWNTDLWERAKTWDGAGHRKIQVSEEWGIVIWLPVQGEHAGTCQLVRADLQRGKRHAQVCHDVRVQRSARPKPEPWTGEELMPKPIPWEAYFSTVSTKEEASSYWQQARAAGVDRMELARLVGLAQQRLRERGISD